MVDPVRFAKPAVVWRNFEASLDVAELEPRTRRISTYALQEYFIPRRHFLPCPCCQTQFERAYPEVMALRALKSRVDPDGRLSNQLWAKYL